MNEELFEMELKQAVLDENGLTEEARDRIDQASRVFDTEKEESR